MRIHSIRPSTRLVHLYEQQLSQKDAQIAALTALLSEAHALLASERMGEGARPTVTGSGRAADAPERSPAPSEGAAMAWRDSAESTPEVTADRVGEMGLDPMQPDTAPLGLTNIDAADSQPHHPLHVDLTARAPGPPIPISYFGPPLSGIEKSLRAAGPIHEEETTDDDRTPDREAYGPATRVVQPQPKPLHSGAQSLLLLLFAVGSVCLVVFFLVSNGRSNGVSELNQESLNAARRSIRQAAGSTGRLAPSPSAAPASQNTVTLPPLASKAQTTDAPLAGAQSPDTKPQAGAPLAGAAPVSTNSGPVSRPAGPPAPPAAATPGQASAQNTALVDAVTRNDVPAARRLVEQGADVNARSEKGAAALSIATRYGFPELVDLLIAHGAKVDIVNDAGWTPLMLAVSYDRPRIMSTLLKSSVNVNAQNGRGVSALMMAALSGNTRMTALLLKHGADPSLKNAEAKTAEDLARQAGHSAIAARLQRAPRSVR